jgi:hypothetical protein
VAYSLHGIEHIFSFPIPASAATLAANLLHPSAATMSTPPATISAVSSASSGALSSTALTSDVAPVVLNPFSTINVKTHVPITLELTRPNFTRWSTFFRAMVRKFGLLPYLDPDVPARPSDLMWAQTDYAIKGWLYNSVEDSVLTLAMGADDQTACALYAAIFNLFNDNKESRAIHLSNEFHTLVQGDSSVADYCQRMMSLADSLHDVGHAVLEPQLILNLVRGLNSKFSITANHIVHTTPFPTFSRGTLYACPQGDHDRQ